MGCVLLHHGEFCGSLDCSKIGTSYALWFGGLEMVSTCIGDLFWHVGYQVVYPFCRFLDRVQLFV